jgi:hypothetical protein
MKVAKYKDWQEYKQNKLASKQADRLYKELFEARKKKDEERMYQIYHEFHESHLYKKHGPLYCQVIADVTIDSL